MRVIRFAEFFSLGESLLFELSTEFFERSRYCRARAAIHFFPFFSLLYQILLFFNFLRLHLLFLGHENDLLLEIDLCRCTVPFSRIFFKLLEIEEGGRGDE